MSRGTCAGTALGSESRIWFTLSGGIIQEVHFPDVDQGVVLDMRLVVAGGEDFISEETADAGSRTDYLEAPVPAFRVTTECSRGRYRIEKEILTDPRRSALLLKTAFIPLKDSLQDYRLYILMTPSLENPGNGTAWSGDFKGVPMLFAEYDDTVLALACSAVWVRRSVGQGISANSLLELHDERRISQIYTAAEDGRLSLLGEIDLTDSRGIFTLVLGSGTGRAEAGLCARSSLLDGFDRVKKEYFQAWKGWIGSIPARDLVPIGASVLKIHESKDFPGGYIAGLFPPRRRAVCLRELTEAAGAFLAAGLQSEFQRIFRYLEGTQEADGRWPREQWLEGTPCCNGPSMDETALTVLLCGLGAREGALEGIGPERLWRMVKAAAQYLVVTGPVSAEERWEDEAGYSLFTLAASISALLEAADLADSRGDTNPARYLRETADFWNSSLERWLFPAAAETGPGCLALVRFGLRPPDDPAILQILRLSDSRPGVDPDQPACALLAGERAHYELAAGNRTGAEQLLDAMESFANELGLFPQVRAHSEHMKLRRSLRDGLIFDRPRQPHQRYVIDRVGSPRFPWRFNQKLRTMPAGGLLRIETRAAGVIHWTADRWGSMEDAYTRDTGVGMNLADLPTDCLDPGQAVEFTFYWPQAGKWENRNFTVEVV